MKEFLNRLPKHDCELILTHNSHKSYYQNVRDSIDSKEHGYHLNNWVNEEQRELAAMHDECWTIQWYPHTPIGFNIMSGYSLEVLLNYVKDE